MQAFAGELRGKVDGKYKHRQWGNALEYKTGGHFCPPTIHYSL
jgi:hypothetical protein